MRIFVPLRCPIPFISVSLIRCVLFGEEGYSSDAVKNVRRDGKDNVKGSSGPKL